MGEVENQGVKRRSQSPAREQGAENSQASPVPLASTTNTPSTPLSPGFLVGRPTEQVSVLSWALLRSEERLESWVQIPDLPLIPVCLGPSSLIFSYSGYLLTSLLG